MPRRNRKMRGGFGEDLWGSITNAYQSAKEKVMGTSSGSTYTPAAPVYTPPPAPAPVGGKRRQSKKNMKGGFSANTPTTGLAATASPISGIASVRSMWVGGKTRKRRSHKQRKSRKH
jgi:hypothetical protein